MSIEKFKFFVLKESFYILFFVLLSTSCKEKVKDESSYIVRSDIRFGPKFYSIYANVEGEAFVIKGQGSDYTEPLQIQYSDTSEVFKLDSIASFIEKLRSIKKNPVFGARRLDAARVEIYYDGKKVYDAYKWDEKFWDLFRPIVEQIPNEYNPFSAINPAFQ